jgi:methylene-tetrahydromethanopterin dehydrogenase
MTSNVSVLDRAPQAPRKDTTVRSEKPSKPIRAPKRQSRATPVLYMLSTQKYMSPFDINMAIDSGYKVIMPYDNVTLADINPLVQDAIFSRPPQSCARTGFFIGGKNINLALEMMIAAKAAMVPPFEVSVFADPGGSFTTAAAMVACVERVLHQNYQRSFKGLRLAVFGAGGVVGFASSVIAALEGARVRVVAHDSVDPLLKLAFIAKERFGVQLEPILGQTEAAKTKIIRESDAIFSAGPAGVGVITRKQMARATKLLVVADVNAVAPAGIEGVELKMDGMPLPGSSVLGIGPLAIGDIKYKTQAGLFRRMLTTDKPLNIDFRDAFTMARRLTNEVARAGKPNLA